MRRISVVSLLVFVLAVMSASTVSAQNIHFNGTAKVSGISSTEGSMGDVTVSFKEVGLGNDALISFSLNANATADYGCINGGGKHPQATNKATSAGPVSATGSFSSGRNGSISASLTLTPPPPPADFSCPGGQTLVVADITYTDITLEDTTNSIEATLSVTDESATFFRFK